MAKIDALLDINVMIAMLVEEHEHQAPSLALLTDASAARYAVAANSYAEAYSTLTRTGPNAPFQFTPVEAWDGLESVRAVTAPIGLSASQSFEAIRSYAQDGGVGARLYDRLIGEVAVAHDFALIGNCTCQRYSHDGGGLDGLSQRFSEIFAGSIFAPRA